MRSFVHKFLLFTLREQTKKVNMEELELVETALEQLKKAAAIQGRWIGTKETNNSLQVDGKLTFTINQQTITLPVEIKKELRNHHIHSLESLIHKYPQLMVLAGNIFPTLREELRERKIAYLEANGNFYLEQGNIFVLIDRNPPYQVEKEGSNRAFTPAGLKVVFHFLLYEKSINQTYREIANKTEASLGNIKNVMDGLKEAKFLLPKDETDWMLTNKRALLRKWTNYYNEALQSKLSLGTYRFVSKETFDHWQELTLQEGETFWGGEPAADLLTHHLRPGQLILYTSESKASLMKNYKLVPDKKGPVKIYQKFWYQESQNTNIAPPLLVYTDLMNWGDKRSRETANIIYEQYLRDQF